MSTHVADATKDGRLAGLLGHGEHVIEVPESIVASLEAGVQDPERVKRCEDHVTRKTAEWLAQNPGKQAHLTPYSVSGAHLDLYGTSLGRFASVEVLERGLPPRPSAADAHMANMAAYVARAMQTPLATGTAAQPRVETPEVPKRGRRRQG